MLAAPAFQAEQLPLEEMIPVVFPQSQLLALADALSRQLVDSHKTALLAAVRRVITAAEIAKHEAPHEED